MTHMSVRDVTWVPVCGSLEMRFFGVSRAIDAHRTYTFSSLSPPVTQSSSSNALASCPSPVMSSAPATSSDATAHPTHTPAPGSSNAPPKRGLEAARRFQLHNPVPATENDWHAYALNRYRAIKVSKTMNVFSTKKGYESPDSEGDDFDFNGWGQDHLWVLRSVRRRSREIEQELGYADKTLQSAMRVLYCDASFEEMYEVS